MTALPATVSLDAALRRRPHLGAWRALIAAPAMVGSLLLLLLVLFGWLGQWEGLVLLGWLASGAAVFTRVGERMAVRLGYGFRRPSARQAALLGLTWLAVLARCGTPPEEVELYVQRARGANAYATGGRSVAVTTGVAADFLARRLTNDHLSGLLAHELGHHDSRGTRFALVTVWLAAPWRFVARFVVGVSLALAGRQHAGCSRWWSPPRWSSPSCKRSSSINRWWR